MTAKQLRKILKRAKLTRSDAALLVGKSIPTIDRYLAGINKIPMLVAKEFNSLEARK